MKYEHGHAYNQLPPPPKKKISFIVSRWRIFPLYALSKHIYTQELHFWRATAGRRMGRIAAAAAVDATYMAGIIFL